MYIELLYGQYWRSYHSKSNRPKIIKIRPVLMILQPDLILYLMKSWYIPGVFAACRYTACLLCIMWLIDLTLANLTGSKSWKSDQNWLLCSRIQNYTHRRNSIYWEFLSPSLAIQHAEINSLHDVYYWSDSCKPNALTILKIRPGSKAVQPNRIKYHRKK